MGTRFLGTFVGAGIDFRETITIAGGPIYTFRHTVERDGATICDETGAVTVDGYQVKFSQFTVCVDDETATIRPEPRSVANLSCTLLREGEPETDRLRPWVEGKYYLEKQPK
jgi:hypothetical protein